MRAWNERSIHLIRPKKADPVKEEPKKVVKTVAAPKVEPPKESAQKQFMDEAGANPDDLKQG